MVEQTYQHLEGTITQLPLILDHLIKNHLDENGSEDFTSTTWQEQDGVKLSGDKAMRFEFRQSGLLPISFGVFAYPCDENQERCIVVANFCRRLLGDGYPVVLIRNRAAKYLRDLGHDVGEWYIWKPINERHSDVLLSHGVHISSDSMESDVAEMQSSREQGQGSDGESRRTSVEETMLDVEQYLPSLQSQHESSAIDSDQQSPEAQRAQMHHTHTNKSDESLHYTPVLETRLSSLNLESFSWPKDDSPTQTNCATNFANEFFGLSSGRRLVDDENTAHDPDVKSSGTCTIEPPPSSMDMQNKRKIRQRLLGLVRSGRKIQCQTQKVQRKSLDKLFMSFQKPSKLG